VDEIAFSDGHDRYVPGHRKGLDAVSHEDRYKWIANTFELAGKRVLDFGCGVGYGTEHLASRALAADGVDISGTAIDYAKQRYSAPNLRFFVADLTGPLPDELVLESYDLVASSEVLEHVPDVFSYVWNLASMLEDDGVAIVGTPNRLWSYETWGGRLAASSHCMEFTPSALANFLRLYFEQVQLYFHVVYPAEVLLGTRSNDVSAAAPVSRRIVRGLRQATAVLAREVLPTERYERLKERFAQPPRTTPSADDGIWTEFVAAQDLGLSPPGAIGLVAVCMTPTRFKPAFLAPEVALKSP
jgi:2-polyprenyl-3-methyl-5-hydroxy-6-metoxy-1,4-benzoquinol methylase